MDALHFDRIARLLGARPSRRGLLRVAAVALAARRNGSTDQIGSQLLAKAKGKGKSKGKKKPRPTPDPGLEFSCALQHYAGSGVNFADAISLLTDDRPDRHLVDGQIFPILDKINACASNPKHEVIVRVVSAYRNFSPSVAGSNSAHTAGHAIDFSIQYDLNDKTKVCRWDDDTHSGCLGTDPPTKVVPPTANNRDYAVDPVNWNDGKGGHGVLVPGNPAATKKIQDFIRCVKASGVRWGGDFKPAFRTVDKKDANGKTIKDKKGKPIKVHEPVCNGAPPCQGADAKSKQQGFDPFHFDDGINQCGAKDARCKQHFAERQEATRQASSLLQGEPGDWQNWNSCPGNRICDLGSGECICDPESECDTDEICCHAPDGICQSGPGGRACRALCDGARCGGENCCFNLYANPPFNACCNKVEDGHVFTVCCPLNIDPEIGYVGACCAEDFPICCTHVCCRQGAICGADGRSCQRPSARGGAPDTTDPGIPTRPQSRLGKGAG